MNLAFAPGFFLPGGLARRALRADVSAAVETE